VGVYTAGTIAGLDVLAKRVDNATRQSVADVLERFQGAGRLLAPKGTIGNTTNAPGDLARSILVEGPFGADGAFEGQVGPTVIYGRQRELGGPIFVKRAKQLRFVKFGTVYYRHAVFQKPEPYLKSAYDLEQPVIPGIVYRDLEAALAGAQ
jgi:hypothetical protein